MSEQSKDNIQTIGAGLLAFLAVVGGGSFFLLRGAHAPASAQREPIAPVSASVVSLPEPSLPRGLLSEQRQASPQPVIGGDVGDVESGSEQAAASPAGAVGSSAHQAASNGPAALGALGAPKHAGKGESTSSARAEVQTAQRQPEAKAAADAPKPMPRVKLDTSRGNNAVASSVHYGVTSRADVMGRAAGPVYNLSGKLPKGSHADELGKKADASLAEAQKKIDESNLTPAQKDELRKKLSDVNAAAK